MVDRLYSATISAVPFSSVVGRSLTIEIEGIGVVAQLAIMVPQPHLDYRLVGNAVAKALTTHGCENGRITLVLPDAFKADAAAAILKARQIAAANQSDDSVTDIGPYTGEDDAGNVGVAPGQSDAEFRRNLRHWKEECGKLHSQIGLKNDVLTQALVQLQITRARMPRGKDQETLSRVIKRIKEATK